MKVRAGGRRAGKTYKVIEAMRTDPAIVMICFSHHSADMCKKEYPDVADRILPPVKEHLQGFHTKRKYILDNADILLERESLGYCALWSNHNRSRNGDKGK